LGEIVDEGNTAILLISCPDRKGLVLAVSKFLDSHGGEILHADQHRVSDQNLFLMRFEWSLDGFDLTPDRFPAAFESIAWRHRMTWRVEYSRVPARVAIFVSHEDHCLVDLLHRWRLGELPGEIMLVVSNHQDARGVADFYKIPFHHIPVDTPNKSEGEERQIDLLARNHIDLIVLARYMQVLSPDFVARYPNRMINVHHSFLPAFTGARPYHAAFERGVKLIGATSHYVTSELDKGPIIEQDVTRVSHRCELEALREKGRDVERMVLSRAVRWHLEHRVLVYGNRTVIFE
jgi:formyltetrahydrofolate deformylase